MFTVAPPPPPTHVGYMVIIGNQGYFGNLVTSEPCLYWVRNTLPLSLLHMLSHSYQNSIKNKAKKTHWLQTFLGSLPLSLSIFLSLQIKSKHWIPTCLSSSLFSSLSEKEFPPTSSLFYSLFHFMATDTRIFPDQNNNNKNNEINRVEIQAAIAKAVELRALHAALVQGSSPANLRFPSSASPANSRHASQFSAQDYPVFTPVSKYFTLVFLFEFWLKKFGTFSLCSLLLGDSEFIVTPKCLFTLSCGFSSQLYL